MELGDLKKFLWIGLALLGLAYYVNAHYTLNDVLTYAKKNPDPKIAPALDYYVGMTYFARSDYGPATKAFEQLLQDYPTSQYVAKTLYRAGLSYEELRRWDRAKSVYEQYMEQFPNGAHVDMVKRHYEY